VGETVSFSPKFVDGKYSQSVDRGSGIGGRRTLNESARGRDLRRTDEGCATSAAGRRWRGATDFVRSCSARPRGPRRVHFFGAFSV
jgi:hypothetical protein